MVVLSQTSWIPLVSAILMGPFANINQMVQVLASQELEGFDEGCAGIIGNMINILDIPCNAIYAYLFFGEVMEPLEYAGGAIICLAIFIVTAAKAKRHFNGKNEKEKDLKETSLVDNNKDDDADDEKDDDNEKAALISQSNK